MDEEEQIIIERDGAAWCAHYDWFQNLAESLCGHGDTPIEALTDLLEKEEEL